MKLAKLIRNSFVALLVIACSSPVLWPANPSSCAGPVTFKIGAGVFPPAPAGVYSGSSPVTRDVPTGRGLWDPADTGWNGRNTAPGGNKIANVNTAGVAFGPMCTVNVGAVAFVGVTAPMVDKYWDEDYYKVGVAGAGKNGGTFTRVSGAQFVQNCYGFATGKGYVVNPDGFTQITTDEYKPPEAKGTLCVAGCVLKLPGDHCILLGECCVGAYKGKDSIKTTSEINGTSGQYNGVWSCATPVFGGQIAGTIYCKKPPARN